MKTKLTDWTELNNDTWYRSWHLLTKDDVHIGLVNAAFIFKTINLDKTEMYNYTCCGHCGESSNLKFVQSMCDDILFEVGQIKL